MTSVDATYRDTMLTRRTFIARSIVACAGGYFGLGTTTARGFDTDISAENACCTDELWLVSTRHLGDCPTFTTPECLDYRRIVCGQCCTASHAEFVEASVGWPTIVYVHGNRADLNSAMHDGLRVYRSLVACCRPSVPVRFVIWAWPSDRVCGPYRDARIKASRTDRQALLMAGLLAQGVLQGPRSLLGYSYGARLCAGALHLLAGGHLHGESLECYGLPSSPMVACESPIHSIWWAGAFPNRWILPGHHYGMAVQASSEVIVMYNRHDPVLRRYRRVLRERDGQAIGFVGVPCAGQLGCFAGRLRTCDVTHSVGKRHDWERYLGSQHVMDITRRGIAIA